MYSLMESNRTNGFLRKQSGFVVVTLFSAMAAAETWEGRNMALIAAPGLSRRTPTLLGFLPEQTWNQLHA